MSAENEEKGSNDEVTGDNLNYPILPSRTCSVLAHNKIALHSLKYLSNSILGVLIGIQYKGDNNMNNIHILDAIPLLHNSFSAMIIELSFLQIETWLTQLNENKKSKGQLQIVGVYFANENTDDRTKSTSAIVIASQIIKETSKTSVLLCQVDNERINDSFDGSDTCLDWYCLGNNGNPENDKDWKETDNIWYTNSNYCNTWSNSNNNKKSSKNIVSKQDIIKYEEFLSHTESLIVIKNNNTGLGDLVKQEKELAITDFEDHLDDLTRDWRNIF